jgi:hypothetical protein
VHHQTRIPNNNVPTPVLDEIRMTVILSNLGGVTGSSTGMMGSGRGAGAGSGSGSGVGIGSTVEFYTTASPRYVLFMACAANDNRIVLFPATVALY